MKNCLKREGFTINFIIAKKRWINQEVSVYTLK